MVEITDGVVFDLMVVETEQQKVEIKTMQGFATKLAFSGDNSVAVNTSLPLTVSYLDWEGNLLPNENRPIHIFVTGSSKAQELVLTPINGSAEFDFVSAVAGTFILTATAEFPCDSAEIKVVVL